jgi:hypothetical protein
MDYKGLDQGNVLLHLHALDDASGLRVYRFVADGGGACHAIE